MLSRAEAHGAGITVQNEMVWEYFVHIGNKRYNILTGEVLRACVLACVEGDAVLAVIFTKTKTSLHVTCLRFCAASS